MIPEISRGRPRPEASAPADPKFDSRRLARGRGRRLANQLKTACTHVLAGTARPAIRTPEVSLCGACMVLAASRGVMGYALRLAMKEAHRYFPALKSLLRP